MAPRAEDVPPSHTDKGDTKLKKKNHGTIQSTKGGTGTKRDK